MSIATKFRRLIDLYKLFWVSDRLDVLETQLGGLRSQLHTAVGELQSQVDQARGDSSRLGETMYQIASQTGIQLRNLGNDLDTLKSSLEVSQEMVDDFFDWKSRNPIPEHPLVSIIVPTYNRSRLLVERCIPSVLNQTYPNLELIIVGDCCTDDTEALVSQIKDPRLKFYNLAERGPYPSDPVRRWMVAGVQAGLKGLSMAQGDFIAHLADDDEYTLDRVEKLVNFAIANQCDVVWHPFWWEQGDGTWIINEAQEFAYTQVTGSSVFYRSWFKNVPGSADPHRLLEPADWNRYRQFKYIGPVAMRHPEPLLRHYREGLGQRRD